MQTRQLVRWSALPLALIAVWAAVMVVRVHRPYLALPTENNVDEGYLLAIGQRMLHGHMLPFVDGVAHSGPLFLYSGALIAAFGEFSWLPIRVVAMLSFTAATLLLFACGWRAGRLLAGAIAAVALPLYVTLRMSAIDAIAYNAELPALLFLLASLYATSSALGTTEEDAPQVSRRWLIAAGAFASCSALSKQIAVLMVLPLAAYVLIAVLARRQSDARERRRLLLIYAASAAVPAVLILAHFAIAGALHDLYYYVVAYNRGPYLVPYRDVSRWDTYRDWLMRYSFTAVLGALAIAWGLAQPLVARSGERSWLAALRRSGFDVMVALWAIGGVVGARASMRFFDHYEILAVPGFGLLVGSLVERAVDGRSFGVRTPWSVTAQVLLLLPLVFLGELTWSTRAPRLIAWSAAHLHEVDLATAKQEPPVCQVIRDHSGPRDRLFVWGFHAQLHVTCARLPASRFVFSSFVSGYVPWSRSTIEVDDQLQVPGTRDLLLRELEESKPPIIVDAGRTFAFKSIRGYAQLFGYLEQHYRSLGPVGGDEVWLRKGAP